MSVARWVDVVGYAGLYEVSDTGHVRSAKSRRKLRPFRADSAGHLAVDLRRDGQARRHQVHHLVAAAWLPQDRRHTMVAHRSDDVTDNAVGNLEWLTPSENSARWFVRNGARPRGADGTFAAMERTMAAVEAQAIHDAEASRW